jgi:hypothetical protein
MAVPDGSDIDITPRVAASQHYIYTETALKHKLLSQCVATTPANQARTDLGVGEQVNLFFAPPATGLSTFFKASAGSVSPIANTYALLFTAPSNRNNVTITVTGVSANIVNGPMTLAFNVLEPTGIDHANIIQRFAYAIGTAGAGMQLTPYLAPTSVSFYRLQCMEVGQPASSVTGYFQVNGAPAHDSSSGANQWFQILQDNSWQLPWDNAGSPTYAPPWSAGTYTWVIPGKWKIDSGDQHDIPFSNQSFTLDSSGTVTVTKFGHTVTRHINEQYGTAQ